MEENPKILGVRNWEKICNGETRVEKLHTRGQGPKKEEEEE